MYAVRRHVKKALLAGFAHAGIDRLAVSLHARDALVLVYHAIVSEQKLEPFRYHHTLPEFESHLEWLGTHCTPVDLAGFGRWQRGDFHPRKPPVLVTFDDGYRNNATVAAPLLTRRGFPATFFLSTGYVGTDRVLWPDEVFLRVVDWPNPMLTDPNGVAHSLPHTQAARHAFAFAMLEACKNCADETRREFLAYLAAATPELDACQDPEVQQFMSWDDARGLAAAGFDLGSHTVDHPVLSNVSPQGLQSELRESRAALQAQTGVACNALAYPNGRARDIGDTVVSAAREAGYESAFVVSGAWSSRENAGLRIDRIAPPGHCDRATFALHASGARRRLQRLRR